MKKRILNLNVKVRPRIKLFEAGARFAALERAFDTGDARNVREKFGQRRQKRSRKF